MQDYQVKTIPHSNDIRPVVMYISGDGGYRPFSTNDTTDVIIQSGAFNINSFVGQSGVWRVSITGQPVYVTGTIDVSNFPALQAISGNVTITNPNPQVQLTGINIVGVTGNTSTSATFTSYSGISGAGIQLVAANPNRIGLYIFNNTDQNLKCMIGNAATSQNFSFLLVSSGAYESPAKLSTSLISGYWDSFNYGKVNITELI